MMHILLYKVKKSIIGCGKQREKFEACLGVVPVILSWLKMQWQIPQRNVCILSNLNNTSCLFSKKNYDCFS
jgi:hypothetical protein